MRKDGSSTQVKVNANGGFVQPIDQESLFFTAANGKIINMPG